MSIGQATAVDSHGLMNLYDYVEQSLVRGWTTSVLMEPQETAVGNERALEYGVTSLADAIMSTGHNQYAKRVHYAIVFGHEGFIYECRMEATSDNYKKYIPVFQEFCASVSFKSD